MTLRRSRAREVVLQLLYQDDLNPQREVAPDVNFISQRLHRNQQLVDFATSLLNGVRRNRGELDELLEKQTTNWSLTRMAATDRNVLRLGAFEILYSDTPGPVAINEAVQLAKRFGARQSSQFVNGILDGLLPGDSGEPDALNARTFGDAVGMSPDSAESAEPDPAADDDASGGTTGGTTGESPS